MTYATLIDADTEDGVCNFKEHFVFNISTWFVDRDSVYMLVWKSRLLQDQRTTAMKWDNLVQTWCSEYKKKLILKLKIMYINFVI